MLLFCSPFIFISFIAVITLICSMNEKERSFERKLKKKFSLSFNVVVAAAAGAA